MEILKMKQEEIRTYEIIKQWSEKEISFERTKAMLPHYNKNYLYDLRKKYREGGISSFAHGNRGRTPYNKSSEKEKQKIVKIYNDDFTDKYGRKKNNCNFVKFQEDLSKYYSINKSVSFLRELLYEFDVLSPRAHKATKKAKNKEVKEREKMKTNIENIENKNIQIIDKEEAIIKESTNIHPLRAKTGKIGLVVEMDASPDYYFNNEKSTLHLITDRNGLILSGRFEKQETLKGYLFATADMLRDYGVPVEIIADRRTVFCSPKASRMSTLHEDCLTQYGMICESLGITLTTSSDPEAKAVVERKFGTFPNRLMQDFRRLEIKTIEEANEILPLLIKQYNEQFSSHIDYSKSVFKEVNNEHIPYYLSTKAPRVVSKGHVIKYKNKVYYPDDQVAVKLFTEKTKVLVIETYLGDLYISVKNQIYKAIEVTEENEEYIRTKLCNPEIDFSRARSFTVPDDHPWKNASFFETFKRNVIKQQHINDKIKKEVQLFR